jgi:hypothetical protein
MAGDEPWRLLRRGRIPFVFSHGRNFELVGEARFSRGCAPKAELFAVYYKERGLTKRVDPAKPAG